jgi:hypothetical protein
MNDETIINGRGRAARVTHNYKRRSPGGGWGRRAGLVPYSKESAGWSPLFTAVNKAATPHNESIAPFA